MEKRTFYSGSNGHVDIVNVLLANNATVNQAKKMENRTLYSGSKWTC